MKQVDSLPEIIRRFRARGITLKLTRDSQIEVRPDSAITPPEHTFLVDNCDALPK